MLSTPEYLFPSLTDGQTTCHVYTSRTYASKFLLISDLTIIRRKVETTQENIMYVLSSMKLAGLFLFLALAFDGTQSQSSSQEKVVCVKENQVQQIFFYLQFLQVVNEFT